MAEGDPKPVVADGDVETGGTAGSTQPQSQVPGRRRWELTTRQAESVKARAALAAAVLGLLTASIVALCSASSARAESLREFRVAAFSAYYADVAEQREKLYGNLSWLDTSNPGSKAPAEYSAALTKFWADMESLQTRIAADYARVRVVATDQFREEFEHLESVRSDAYRHYKCRAALEPCKELDAAPLGQRQSELAAYLSSGAGDIGPATDAFIAEFSKVVNT